jgi:N utilization substance protein B
MTAPSGNRRQSREAALGYLYQSALGVDTRTQPVQSFINHFQLSEAFRPYFERIVEGVVRLQDVLDLEIETAAENWKISRMSKVDLSILRMATFELVECVETSHQIIIDEAVELAKTYGNSDSSSFVNGILDRIAQKLRGPREGVADLLKAR